MSAFETISISDGPESGEVDSDASGGSINMSSDWMQAVKSPVPFRVGNRLIRLRITNLARPRVIVPVFIILITVGALFILLPNTDARYTRGVNSPRLKTFIHEDDMFRTAEAPVAAALPTSREPCADGSHYNTTYPLSRPEVLPDGSMRYRIGVISDLDTDSKSKVEKFTWLSHFLKGHLTLSANHDQIQIKWEERVTLKETLSQGGRGMELSELVVFDGKLYTVDDRTGVVYLIENDIAIPWVVLPDGNGKSGKGFKCEWATVKDKTLYVGGLGKEWTTVAGKILNTNPQWVKAISPSGVVRHLDWHEKYNALKKSGGINNTGYIIHESAVWSDVWQRWFFLPRRASNEQYNDVDDENRGTNMLFTCDDSFRNCEMKKIGKIIPTHGFSSFKFIPGTGDKIIVAIKSEENADAETAAAFIMAFTIDGKILMDETKIGDFKFEGVEFI
ncbi:PREDICTED: soluble calcium-activated nucleotidase 1-like [Priapulus caudatus]|uniref:Soluble calcium-activated nucleotidase 1-like n=1 Tax=Priapulus caudatus TaxID=37621 RepID=A0ABM1E6V7_PRICU|nr:PREDICTED: soluble calcium-activated nucleotidase 1-like [Priapulus caudatus]